MSTPATPATPVLPPPVEPGRASAAQSDAGPTPAAEAAEKIRAEQLASQKNELLPANLSVSLDRDAGRFVQTLTDATTQETLRRYPNEQQLAFSRAVNAYNRALVEK